MIAVRLAIPCLIVIARVASAQATGTENLPGAAVERDTTSMLSDARIAALGGPQQTAWRKYVRRSREHLEQDHSSVAAELDRTGKKQWTIPPWTHDLVVQSYMTNDWFRGDSARRLADNIISYQTPSGGWSKHVDMAKRPRQLGESYIGETAEWHYIGTFDNSATTTQMRILGGVYNARPEQRYRDAFLKGLAYTFDAQFPNGCWPQVYPLQGGYHDEATFNDDAIMNNVSLLQDIMRGAYPLVPAAEQARAAERLQLATECILNAQVIVNGKRTVWGQQHDPLTLLPASARSYELTSLVSKESVPVVDFLMSIEKPSARVVNAVHAAVAWFRKTQINGTGYAGYVVSPQADATPLWARMYEIGTDRPIFSNRDGVQLYDWDQLKDRRRGYAWYVPDPIPMLRRYDSWAREHPLGAPLRASH